MPALNIADDLKVGSSQVDKVYMGTALVWPTAPALDTYVEDNFDRANATSVGAPQVGPSPTVIERPSGAGDWGISSNKLYPVSAQTENACLWDVGQTEYVFESTMSTKPGDGGFLFRSTSTGSGWLLVYPNTGAWEFYDYNGTGYTLLSPALAGTPTSGDVVTVTVRATSVRLDVNGVPKLYIPTTLRASNTYAGFRENGSTTGRFDDLSITEPPALPTIRINDTFTRSDGVVGASPEGPIGITLNQTWAIASNKLAPANASEAIIQWATDAAEYEMEFTFSSLSADPGGCVRMADGLNFILAQMNSTGTSAIYKRVAGTYTAITTPTSISWTNGDAVRIVNTLTSITVYRNGASVMSVTDSTHSGSAACGFRASSSTVRFDDLKVTAL